MPHNRSEREKPIRQNYKFVVFADTEFSVFNAALIATDVIVFGGNYSLDYIKTKLGDFGKKVSAEMVADGINPLNEPVYCGVMTFQNWETPAPNTRISLPNKHVPYVAAQKNTVSNTRTPFQIEIEEDNMKVIIWSDNGTGYVFNGVYKVPMHNMAELKNIHLMFNGGAELPGYRWDTPGVSYPGDVTTDAKKISWWDNWIKSIPNNKH